MGKYRKRFNEKARSGMLAKQAALKKMRQKQFTRHLDNGSKKLEEEEQSHEGLIMEEGKESDPNLEILKPMSDAEKAERKRKLEEQLFQQQESKISKNKKKRLDKYIEHQLKREEKKELLEKLQKTKFDTSLLKPSKLLGSGRQTRREEFIEALNLEKQGKSDERTRNILYEEREVKEWDADEDDMEKFEENLNNGEDQNEEKPESNDFNYANFQSTDTVSSNIQDYRPNSGISFTFKNIVKVPKKKKKWNSAVETIEMERKAKNLEAEQDFLSSSDEEEEEEEEEAQSSDSHDQDKETEELDSEENESGEEISEAESQSGMSESNDDEDEDEEEEEEEEEEKVSKFKPHFGKKGSQFKEWAASEVRKLEGTEESIPTPILNIDYKPIDRPEDREEISLEEYIPLTNGKGSRKRVYYVQVERPEEIQKQRSELPIFAQEFNVMELIHNNDCVILCGETGSGKTTQVPQFLFEAGYGSPDSDTPGMIGVTQPRRVAAVSMASRVSKELGNHGNKVGYQIRFDSTTKPNTSLKFMTDGVLLREMMTDFMLSKYSAIIIDEAHERNINTDILIGMLSRILKLRNQYHEKDPVKYKKLKLVIMSATLRVSDFSENLALFEKPPPMIKIEARQYPVSIHFNRRTSFNYLEEAFRKTCKIHQRLPQGGILIFLTGQNEIKHMVTRLRKEFPFEKKSKRISHSNQNRIVNEENDAPEVKINAKHVDAEVEDIDFSVRIGEEEKDDYDEDQETQEEEEGFEEALDAADQVKNQPLYVLPLYSLLPTAEQMKVFQEPPKGSRICIVATNVAETSLTIPGIRYVVDCGRSKERKFNEDTGVQSFEIDWISKASADQRSGRAGRTGPGHCYRLYSSAVFEGDFEQFSKPEILRMPVETVVLSMKSMGIDNIINFPFPTPPDRFTLSKAEKLLRYLGALNTDGNITELGKTMSLFPLSPRFSKMLIVSNQFSCLPYVVAIVSALSVGDPFINENELGISNEGENDNEMDEDNTDKEAKRQLRKDFYASRKLFSKLDKNSDALRLLSCVCAVDHIPLQDRLQFFKDNFLRPKVMEEIIKLRKQIMFIVKVNTEKENIALAKVTDEADFKVGIPSKTQLSALKQMIASGFIDQVAIRGDLGSSDVTIANRTNIINIPYITLFPSKSSKDENIDPYVYIHPGSVIVNSGELPPPYLIYQSLNLSSNSSEKKLTKLRMKPLTEITGKALANIAKNSSLVTYSKPLGHPYAPKNVSPTRRECYVIPRFGASIGTGGIGWDLPVIKVFQNKINGSWVIDSGEK